MLVNSLVLPYFNYCSSVWAGATKGRLAKLETRLKHVRRFLGNESNILLKDLLHKNDAVFMYKAISRTAPGYMCSKVNLAKNSHSHGTRGASKTGSHFPW